jgi:hypothetical protein
VDKINSSIGQDPTATSIIGVLDIYGFESFKINRYVGNYIWSCFQIIILTGTLSNHVINIVVLSSCVST